MKNLLFLGILILTITSCNLDSQSNDSTIETESKNSTTASDSLAIINKEIIQNPDNPNLYFQKAKYFWNRKNLKSTIQELDRALSIDSTNLDYYNYKGLVLYESNELLEAKEIFKKVIDLDELNIFANIKMAWISLIAGQHESCFIYANNALKNNQYLAEPYYLKGLAYKETGNFKLSVSNFRTATEQDNDYLNAWLQLGYLYDAAEDTLAGAYYENALRIDSNNIDALYAFGSHLQKWGLADEAITQYQHIIRVDNDYHNAYYNIGYVYLEIVHNNDSAIKYYDKVLDLNPYNFKGYYNRGLAYERKDMNTRARADYEKSLEIKPDYDLAAKGMSRVVK